MVDAMPELSDTTVQPLPYRHVIRDTRSGTSLQQMLDTDAPSEGRFATLMNGIETGQHSFMLRGSSLTRADWHELIDPWRRTIDVEYGPDRIPYSGLIMGWNYDRPTGKLTVASAEVRSILVRRRLFGIGTYENGNRHIAGLSRRGIIHMIMLWSTQGNLSPVWDLPFNFGDTSAEPGPESRDYWAYEFPDADKLITDEQDSDGGPDVHFQAQKRPDGSREYLLRLGNPVLGGPALEFSASGDKPNALDVVQKGSGEGMATGIFTIGTGSGPDIRHGEQATGAGPGFVDYPSLDLTRQLKNIADTGELTSRAAAELSVARVPTVQTSYKVTAEDFFGPGGTVGSVASVWDEGDEWIEPGYAQQRVLGFRGDLTNRIELITQGA